jgi:hypothetical protein
MPPAREHFLRATMLFCPSLWRAMSNYDELIRQLLEKRRERLAFAEQNARDALFLADAIELRMGAPEGSIRVLDRNGVPIDEESVTGLDDPAQLEFILALTVEHEMEILATARVKVSRIGMPDGQHEYFLGEQPVQTASFTDPSLVESTVRVLELFALEQKMQM